MWCLLEGPYEPGEGKGRKKQNYGGCVQVLARRCHMQQRVCTEDNSLSD